MAVKKELTERDWNLVVQYAAKKNDALAKKKGPEFYDAYLSTVKQMEENEKKGINCTYDVGYEM